MGLLLAEAPRRQFYQLFLILDGYKISFLKRILMLNTPGKKISIKQVFKITRTGAIIAL